MTHHVAYYDPFDIFQKFAEFSNSTFNSTNKYPPYDVYVINKDSATEKTNLVFRFALAGFTKEDISVEIHEDGILKVSGKMNSVNAKNVKVIKRGIATRTFEIKQCIPNCCKKEPVASFENGILELAFEVIKNSPKQIAIN